MGDSVTANPLALAGSEGAFPELDRKVPLTPQMDDDLKTKLYRWGNAPIPVSRQAGSHTYTSIFDNRNHEAVRYPWTTDMRGFLPNLKPEADRINTQYSNMLSDHLPEGGFTDKPLHLSAEWERLLAYHHGLYHPERFRPARTEDEIRLAVNDFAAKLQADDPKNACKYLMLEEFKCLHAQQAHMDPEGAGMKCVKWFNEWRQCMWDQEKMNKGYTYIEDRPPRKHRPYIGTPDWQYA